ncbi:hypothetical protein ACQ4PT_048635 [Festuca glaucescens]
MELLVLLALVLVGFSVLLQRRRSYSSAKRARAPAPVVIQKIGDPAVAHRALVENADDFSNRPLAPFLRYLAERNGGRRGESLASVSHSPLWRAFRCNLTAESLHPSRLGHLAPLQREGIEALVASLSSSAAAAGEGTVNFAKRNPKPCREHLCAPVFPIIARLCFGDGVDGCHVRAMGSVIRRFQQIAVGEARASPGTLRARLAEWRRLRRLLALHGRMGELFLPLVATRWESRGPCNGLRPYVDSIIDLRVPVDGDDGGRRGVRDDEMVNLFSEFLGAGAGTIGACLEWTLAHLVNRQDVQQKLRDEVDGGDVFRRSLIRGMPYLNAVVLESLRLHPLVPFMQRHVQADVAARVVGGTATVPAGDVFVQFTLGGIGRDKNTWKDPDEFRPERFLPGGEAEDVGPLPGPKEIRTMMPFGAGYRFCPGSGVAMVNIKCFLAALVRELEWAAPTEDCAGVDLTELDTFIKTMKKPLSARLTPRALL